MRYLLFLSIFLFATGGYAQQNNTTAPVSTLPYISVDATAEREVVPDEIYIDITIVERFEGKEKISIEAQEKEMVDKLKSCGLSIADIALGAADERYRATRMFRKDVMARKVYEVKVKTAEMAGKVLDGLESLKISGATITKVEYSKKEELKKQLLIEAMTQAKEKAAYMLEAIHQKSGKPVFVEELEMRNVNSNYTRGAGDAYPQGLLKKAYDKAADDEAFEFKKIKFIYGVRARFAID